MEKKFVTQITLIRDGFDDYVISDVDTLLNFNLKINDPYYKTRLLSIGDQITLDEKNYTVNKIGFLLHSLDHINMFAKTETFFLNCDVVVELI